MATREGARDRRRRRQDAVEAAVTLCPDIAVVTSTNALAIQLIDHGQHTERVPVGEAVMDEVHAPWRLPASGQVQGAGAMC
jgi:hypothetical protein